MTKTYLDPAHELCQRYKIVEGEAYLKERMGNVEGALELYLRTVEKRLKELRAACRGGTVKVVEGARWVRCGVLHANRLLLLLVALLFDLSNRAT